LSPNKEMKRENMPLFTRNFYDQTVYYIACLKATQINNPNI